MEQVTRSTGRGPSIWAIPGICDQGTGVRNSQSEVGADDVFNQSFWRR